MRDVTPNFLSLMCSCARNYDYLFKMYEKEFSRKVHKAEEVYNVKNFCGEGSVNRDNYARISVI